MKRFALIFAAMLLCGSALAETSVLWENTSTYQDTDGTSKEETVKISLQAADGVTIEQLETAEDNVADGFFATVSKEGVAPVTVCITPACIAAHANLNAATDEQLQAYIDLIAERYDDPMSEIHKTENGNTYLSVGTDVIRSVWTIFDDTNIELVQYNEDLTTPLTADDQAFAVEVLQGLIFESTDAQ